MDGIAGLVLADALPDSGEVFINHVTIACKHCEHVLAEGAFTVKPDK
jgi:hypothetical protein